MSHERPDPDEVQTRTDLGRALSALRQAAGLTVRELARRVGSPPATLGGYFAGSHLPNLSQIDLYRSIIAECGANSTVEIERWERALDRARSASDGRAAKGAAPYRGLEPFKEADAELFFGRSAAIAELLERLGTLRDDPGPSEGVLALVGPSGSGKSSLLGAGLVPAVRAGALNTPTTTWDCVVTTPSSTTDALMRAPVGDGRQLLLVVDQFEEALAAPPGSSRRAGILEALLRPDRIPALVVLGLRADYYGAATTESVVAAALRHAQVVLGPMSEDEVRQAVAGPARASGTSIEDGLVDLVLSDLAPGSPTGFAHDAGALPLLSHALLVTWQRARRNQLTIADYRTVGGLRGAVSQSADELYQALVPADQDLARQIFSRLVRIDGDGPLTRRRVQRQDMAVLQERAEDAEAAKRVLERFVAARLLTADADTVEISHEALLGAWPRLAGWIDADRAGLRLHHQLSDAAHVWEAAGEDDALLWRGAPLETAAEWVGAPQRTAELIPIERHFLDASIAHRDARQRAAHRRTRRTQQLLALTAVLALVASLLSVYAFSARASASRSRDAALSRQMAIEAQQLRATKPALAAKLALAAYRISPTIQARSTLIEASGGELPTRLIGPVGPEFLASAGGRLLAVAQSSTDTVELYSISGKGPKPVAQLRVGPSSDQDFTVALSPDGRLLAAGDTGGHVVVWNVAHPVRPAKLATLGGFSSTVYSVAFSPSGNQLAAADNDGTVGQWDLSDPSHPVAEPTVQAPGAPAMKSVAYSPRGNLVAAAGAAGTLVTWAPGSADASRIPGAGSATLESVAFSPNGKLLATGGDDDDIRVWTVSASGQFQVAHTPITPGSAQVTCLGFSPDGDRLAACWQNQVLSYDTQTWKQVANFSLPNLATAAVFSPSGATLTTADADGTTRRWHLPPPASYQTSGDVFSLQYSANGSTLAAVTDGPSGDVTFWNDQNPLHPSKVATVTLPATFGPCAGAAAVGSHGRLLAVDNAKAEIQLIDISHLHHPRLIGSPLKGNKPYIEQIAFTPDGKVLAAGDDSGQIRLWDIADPAEPRPLPTIRGHEGEIPAFSISHDGRLLAAGSTDGKVLLYDIADPQHPRRLATLGGFASYAYSTAFTPNGRMLVAGGADGTLRLWTIAAPARPRLLGRILSGLTGDIYQIAISPNGRTLAASTTVHMVGLWDIADPAHPAKLAAIDTASGSLFAITFDPRSHTVVSSGSDHTVHLWDYATSDVAHEVCADTGNPITRTEWAEYVQGATYDPPCAARSPH